MKTSERTGELLVALLKAKANFQPIVKNQHVTVNTKTGRKYDYDYADLPSIQAATAPALSAEGLIVMSGVVPGPDGTVEVCTRLLHTSEQWIESRIPSGALEDVKALGGFVSYARRYNHLALLDLAGEDDVDGSQATGDHLEPRTKATSVPATNSHMPSPEPDEALAYPTEAHLAALRTLALETCHEDLEAFETRLRRTAGLPAHASLAPKLLCRTLNMTTYMEVYGWYVKLAEQLAKSRKEAPDGPASPDVSASTAPPAPTEESPAVPSVVASPSAPGPEDDATERDRQRLRAEVASWPLRVSESEVEHIILHHPYSRARTLLWQARRQETTAA